MKSGQSSGDSQSRLGEERAEPMLLLGASRREYLERWLRQVSETWRQGWTANSADPIQVELASALNRAEPSGNDHRELAVTVMSEALGALVAVSVPVDGHGALFGFNAVRHAASSGNTVAHCAIVEAIQALCVRLVRQDGITDTAFCSSPDLPAYGLDATWRSDTGRVLLKMRLSAKLLLAVLPKSNTVPSTRLATRCSAIADESVRIQAWLGDTEVTLAELARLQVGDVLLLDTALTGAAHLSVLDEASRIPLRVGRVGQRRAVSPAGTAP